jgi:hypothetical protein
MAKKLRKATPKASKQQDTPFPPILEFNYTNVKFGIQYLPFVRMAFVLLGKIQQIS